MRALDQQHPDDLTQEEVEDIIDRWARRRHDTYRIAIDVYGSARYEAFIHYILIEHREAMHESSSDHIQRPDGGSTEPGDG